MYLTSPLKGDEIENLNLGDIVYISGIICTARDKAHEKALEEGRFPVDLKGGVIFHSGPIVRKDKDGWKIIAIGPTTSSRMNSLEPEFIKKFGIRAIIGKGGMSKDVINAMKGNAVYLSMTGGCAAISAKFVKKVVSADWLELGIPEAVFVLEVEKMGPLIVSIDTKGNSLYEKVNEDVKRNIENI